MGLEVGQIDAPHFGTLSWDQLIHGHAAHPHRGNAPEHDKGSYVMIRTTIISVIASFVIVGAWTVNLVSYHPATDLNPLAPLGTNVDWK